MLTSQHNLVVVDSFNLQMQVAFNGKKYDRLVILPVSASEILDLNNNSVHSSNSSTLLIKGLLNKLGTRSPLCLATVNSSSPEEGYCDW